MSSEADFGSGKEPALPLPDALSADDLGLIGSPDIIARNPMEQLDANVRMEQLDHVGCGPKPFNAPHP
jgi:hypothetical protein